MLRTTSKRSPGHHRGGAFHSAKGSEWPEERFTPDQLEQLRADPFLLVEVGVEGEPSGQPPARALPAAGAAEDAKRKADLDAREKALEERSATLEQAGAALEKAEAALAARGALLEQNSAALDKVMADEAFRAIAHRYAVKRVMEGKQEGDLTKDGRPTTDAIEREALGIPITAKERDALVEELAAA
jgi:hypothetical protein